MISSSGRILFGNNGLAENGSSPQNVAQKKEVKPVPAKVVNILFVDDQKIYHVLAKRLLINNFAPLPVNIIDAYNADRAIAEVKAHIEKGEQFDVIFMDNLMLPGITGAEASAIIRNLPGFSAKIITYSDSVTEKYKAADDIIAKTLLKENLANNPTLTAIKTEKLANNEVGVIDAMQIDQAAMMKVLNFNSASMQAETALVQNSLFKNPNYFLQNIQLKKAKSTSIHLAVNRSSAGKEEVDAQDDPMQFTPRVAHRSGPPRRG